MCNLCRHFSDEMSIDMALRDACQQLSNPGDYRIDDCGILIHCILGRINRSSVPQRLPTSCLLRSRRRHAEIDGAEVQVSRLEL